MSRVRLRTELGARLPGPLVLAVSVLLPPPCAAAQTKPESSHQQPTVPDSAHAVVAACAPPSLPTSEVRLKKSGTEVTVTREPEL